jgi:hypothetical protein
MEFIYVNHRMKIPDHRNPIQAFGTAFRAFLCLSSCKRIFNHISICSSKEPRALVLVTSRTGQYPLQIDADQPDPRSKDHRSQPQPTAAILSAKRKHRRSQPYRCGEWDDCCNRARAEWLWAEGWRGASKEESVPHLMHVTCLMHVPCSMHVPCFMHVPCLMRVLSR